MITTSVITFFKNTRGTTKETKRELTGRTVFIFGLVRYMNVCRTGLYYRDTVLSC